MRNTLGYDVSKRDMVHDVIQLRKRKLRWGHVAPIYIEDVKHEGTSKFVYFFDEKGKDYRVEIKLFLQNVEIL